MQIMTGNTMYVLQDIPGKGKGLVATQDILKGTRILSEQPIIVVPRKEQNSELLWLIISSQVDELDEHRRQSFLTLHNIHSYEDIAMQYFGIIRTNALPTNKSEGGIFLEACRINHACDNNAQKNWNSNINRHTVHALRDIRKGEEITIHYFGIHKSRKTRNEAFQSNFGFTCSCRWCSLPPDQSQESDRRLDDIHRLYRLGSRGGEKEITDSPLQYLRYVDQRIRLYVEQGLKDTGLPQAYSDAAQIAIANGDLTRGRCFAEKAVCGWCTALGSDSTEVIQHNDLAKDPSTHCLYGKSSKWKTTVDEVPRGLEPEELEDWLWRRREQSFEE